MSILSLIVQFVGFSLLQGFMFNGLTLFDIARPHLFVLFLLMMPTRLSLAILFSVAFLMGITVDIFTQPLGGFAFAAVFIVGVRQFWMIAITPSLNFLNIAEEMDLQKQGTTWLITYLTPLIFLFELIYFTLIDLSFNLFTLYKAFASGIYTAVFVLLAVILFYKRSN
jgi:hypothetical protein